ncbi:hypothetical protein HTZ77_08505 [Nonomuraea sp. SMC257]|uniref:ESX-1 secretion-associated protein n=1 Tax=Nonomuraea montanisoli TaxID=2741721 RepID=A0A7Y6I6P1_9ACTN|nr:hypothetical protein [Nonomuraea montanisoli]NUW31464.1 hypothetical protein [Nonomuraea montanisoli]
MTGTPGDREQVSVSLDGREAAGRNYRTLADEYAQFAAGLRGSLSGGLLDLPEINGPYGELVTNLHERCRQVEMRLRHAGDGQVAAAATFGETEAVAGEAAGRLQQAFEA